MYNLRKLIFWGIGALLPLGLPEAALANGSGHSHLSEIKFGALRHSSGPFADGGESGLDLNAEALFSQPGWGWWDNILSPRPMLGATINLNGFTNQVYGGLTWEWRPVKRLFTDFSFGLALHDGETTDKPGQKDRALGSHLLFRTGLEVGYQITCRHSASIAFSHISHAGLFNDENAGLDTLGVRYGYRF